MKDGRLRGQGGQKKNKRYKILRERDEVKRKRRRGARGKRRIRGESIMKKRLRRIVFVSICLSVYLLIYLSISPSIYLLMYIFLNLLIC